MPPSHYQHEPLPEGEFTRVLRVEWPDDDSQPTFRFDTIPLSAEIPPYKAISYRWGDSQPVKHVTCTDGRLLGLSETLASLIDALLRKDTSWTLWIDALCINQSDNEEKAFQVALMGKIYSRASDVLVWLGNGDESSERLFQWMKTEPDPQPYPLSKTLELNPTAEVRDDMLALTSRAWFSRVWVIQELALGRNVLVMCGDDLVAFSIFEDCYLICIRNSALGPLKINQSRTTGRRLPATTLLRIRRAYHYYAQNMPLETLLNETRNFSATDSRDHIYAIQSLVVTTDLLPRPDYTIRVEELFIATSERILGESTTLDILLLDGLGHRAAHAGPQQSNAGTLPSWVLDLRIPSSSGVLMQMEEYKWNAGGALRERPLRVEKGLQVKTIIFDQVAHISLPISTKNAEQLEMSLDSARKMMRLSREASSENPERDLARALIHDSNIWAAASWNSDPDELWQGLLRLLELKSDWYIIEHHGFYERVIESTAGWRPFVSAKGYVGVGHRIAEVGDCIALVPGCHTPLLLRPVSDTSPGSQELSTASIIGNCYVHGIMFGEGLEGKESRWVTLV